MVLFAKQDWGWIIQVVIWLVVAGVTIINRIMKGKDEEPETRPRARALPRARNEGQENMNPRDIGDLLDEVLAERRVVEPARPKPVVVPRGTEVVVVRPAGRPQRATGRARPAPMARPVTQPAKRLPTRVTTEAQPAPAPVTARSSGSVQQAAGQPPMTSQATTAQQPVGQAKRPGRTPDALSLFALLRSRDDIRRAIILSEVLGPPVSRRRR
ncbi:MAG: hypothetical protein HY000_13225 [Planctomycetes bacterium]|nr:hypothetical protein [Planctomycetota bacterium]